MTVDVTGGTAVTPWDEFKGAGQEDVKATDLSIPRLKIDAVCAAAGNNAAFVDTITKEAFTELTVIFLGLIKQRAFFAQMSEDTENKPPICKSNDFELGWPTEPRDNRSALYYDWSQSGIDPRNSDIVALDPDNQRVRIVCETCRFKDWIGGNQPPCNEIHTYAVLYSHPGTQKLLPALFSVKSSGIKNSRGFIQTFAGQDRPMFTAWTRLSLTSAKRGSVPYAVPNFAPLMDMDKITPPAMYRDWYTQYNDIREMLRQNPRPIEDETATAEPPPPPPTPAAPAPWAGFGGAVPEQSSGPDPWGGGTPVTPVPEGDPWAPAAQVATSPAAAAVAAPPPPAPPVQASPPMAPPATPAGRVPPPPAPPAAPVATAPVQAPPTSPPPAAAPVAPIPPVPVGGEDEEPGLPF